MTPQRFIRLLDFISITVMGGIGMTGMLCALAHLLLFNDGALMDVLELLVGSFLVGHALRAVR